MQPGTYPATRAPAGTRGAAIYARYVGRTVCHRTAIIAHADRSVNFPGIRGGRTADPDGTPPPLAAACRFGSGEGGSAYAVPRLPARTPGSCGS